MRGSIAPGLGLSVVVALVCVAFGHLVPIASPLLVAIVLGAVLANLGALPRGLKPGLDVAGKRLLRLGIVLLGLQLSLSDVVGLGPGMLAVVLAVVGFGVLGTLAIGARLGISWSQRILIACGFSICGAAAVAAADGVVEAEDEEVATAIALVVLCGTLSIGIVPGLAALLGLSSTVSGLWEGASIHEVAQVVAAAGITGGSVLAGAVVVKLARVLMLAPVMAALAVHRRRQIARQGLTGDVRMPPLVPVFVLGFLAMVVLASVVDIPDRAMTWAKLLETGLLAAAMFALGTGVRRDVFRSVGPRPLVLAALSTLLVTAIGLVGVLLVS